MPGFSEESDATETDSNEPTEQTKGGRSAFKVLAETTDPILQYTKFVKYCDSGNERRRKMAKVCSKDTLALVAAHRPDLLA
jgi:hypothetical protein